MAPPAHSRTRARHGGACPRLCLARGELARLGRRRWTVAGVGPACPGACAAFFGLEASSAPAAHWAASGLAERYRASGLAFVAAALAVLVVVAAVVLPSLALAWLALAAFVFAAAPLLCLPAYLGFLSLNSLIYWVSSVVQ